MLEVNDSSMKNVLSVIHAKAVVGAADPAEAAQKCREISRLAENMMLQSRESFVTQEMVYGSDCRDGRCGF